MPETREVRSVVEAAEQAAAASDYASAEQLLREAAFLQEASLGPHHPDLANTLNNLGVVCEITEKPVDAELYFRRACAIATAALPPDDPFVATSRKNLEDFCEARGLAIDSPTPLPAVAAGRNASTIVSIDLPPARWSRPLVIGAVIASGLLVSFIVTATWFRSNDEVESPLASARVSPPESPSPTASSPPADPIPTDTPKVLSSVPPVAAVHKEPATELSVLRPPLVAAAQLCSDLSTRDWQCVPPSLPVGPGSLLFYTRLKSPTDTTVQHRWYRGNRLRQVVELPIRANTTGGYRTYSRNTVNNQGAGEWRVELRTKDGVLLHEERFVVR
jgi:Protein of unknown function (DUF2914)/Tetratricopeptide repeat